MPASNGRGVGHQFCATRTTSVGLRADDGLRPFPGNFKIERCQVVGLICRPPERRGIFWRLVIFLGVAVDLPQYRGQSANIGNIDDVTVDAFHHRFADRAAVWRHDPATASQRLARHETKALRPNRRRQQDVDHSIKFGHVRLREFADDGYRGRAIFRKT